MPVIHGFELIREQHIPELNATASLYCHQKTGAELLSLQTDDENKVFNITFRTPPADSTGVPHIMEHAVLGGSRKYPLKEPFVELVKGSLKTYLNAMTYPDQTSYPVASTNLKDFYNLVDVYLDAVFYPLITPHHLAQEGWHYELEEVDAPLALKGVVYNEMKGAYSSPDNLLYRASKAALLPDTPYAHDSGGSPSDIPNLTYAQFTAFHDTYYHPSNARLIFYGDDDPIERLRLLNGWLSAFDARPVASELPLQPRLNAPRRLVLPYTVDEEDAGARKGYIQLNWLLSEADDAEESLMLSILSYALVSTPASPLRKALIDSGLGEQLTGGGLSLQLRQMTFAVGLKHINLADADAVEAVILDTLRQLAADGLDPEMVEAAVNTIEFRLRENNTGASPRGLVLAQRALRGWLHGRDPLARLGFAAPLAAVKARLAADPQHLQQLIQAHLLDNPHRVTVILQPDPALQAREDEAERAKLAQIRAGMSPAELEAAVAYTHELRRRQAVPDSPELLASIPRLALADLDREIKTVPTAVSTVAGVELLYHDLFTNGILYLDLAFDLQGLPPALLPYVSIFGQMLREMGTETEDFVKLSQRIGRKTGGIGHSTFTSALQHGPASAAYLMLHGKATVAQAPDLLAILQDMLQTVRLDNPSRLRQMVLQAKAGRESGLIPGGHGVVNTRLRAQFDEAGWAREQISGISNLFFLRRLATQIDQDWPAVLAQLEELRRHLVNRGRLTANVTLDADNWQAIAPRLHAFLAQLPAAPLDAHPWQPELTPANEGLTVPAQVNYVAKGANIARLGYEPRGSISVIGNLLRNTYLWEKIRVQGGAYGAFNVFDRRSGVWTFLSYRDPNLLDTLRQYDGAADFLRDLTLTDDELTKGIIGAISQLDAYQLPDAKGYSALVQHLLGETDAERQQYRDEVLSTTPADFRAFVEVLEGVREHGQVVILGSPDAIAAANGDGWLQVSRVL